MGTAEQKRAIEPAFDQFDPLEAVRECALEQEESRTGPGGAIPAHGSKFHVEQVGHGMPLVRCAPASDKCAG